MDNKELCIKYPFLQKKDDYFDSTWLDDFEEGWRIAFGELFCEDLDRALNKDGLSVNLDEGFHFLQVKEKWGALTIYVSTYTPEVEKVLAKYKYISQFVCRKCGAPYPLTSMVYKYWVSPLCFKCFRQSYQDVLYSDYVDQIIRDERAFCKGPDRFIIACDAEVDIQTTWRKIQKNFIVRNIK